MSFNPNFTGKPDALIAGATTLLGGVAGAAGSAGAGAGIAAAAAAAAPVVIGAAVVGGAVWGISKLFKKK